MSLERVHYVLFTQHHIIMYSPLFTFILKLFNSDELRSLHTKKAEKTKKLNKQNLIHKADQATRSTRLC